jgi:hypothetical protein
MDWDLVRGHFGSVCGVSSGQPPLSTQLVAGMFFLQQIHNLSGKEPCARWVEPHIRATKLIRREMTASCRSSGTSRKINRPGRNAITAASPRPICLDPLGDSRYTECSLA